MKTFLKSFLSTVTVGVFLCATCVCIQLSYADDPGVGVKCGSICNYDCTNRTGLKSLNPPCATGACWTWGLLCDGCTCIDLNNPGHDSQTCVCY
jgi:hypothetical protein